METPSNSVGSFFELVSFLVSSARGAPEEGVYTASLRLIDAAGRLTELAADYDSDDFLSALGAEIRAGATTSYLRSAEEYVAFLDRILESVATEIRHRNDLDPA